MGFLGRSEPSPIAQPSPIPASYSAVSTSRSNVLLAALVLRCVGVVTRRGRRLRDLALLLLGGTAVVICTWTTLFGVDTPRPGRRWGGWAPEGTSLAPW
eukprot:3349249-Rhodomonas_salina.1